jgi:hypothetical protein
MLLSYSHYATMFMVRGWMDRRKMIATLTTELAFIVIVGAIFGVIVGIVLVARSFVRADRKIDQIFQETFKERKDT